MATSKKDVNPYRKSHKVVINNPDHFLNKKKGIVKHTFDSSVEVLLNNKLTVVINYKFLKRTKNA